MKPKYFEANIDELGRIVIPKEIMAELELKEKDELAISLTDGEIALYPRKGSFCSICYKQSSGRLYDVKGKSICITCLVAIDNNELTSDFNGISDVRKVDELGRFVLPIADRRALRLEPNNKVFIHIEDGGIFIKPAIKSCYVCNTDKSLMIVGNKNICADCMEKIADLVKDIS